MPEWAQILVAVVSIVAFVALVITCLYRYGELQKSPAEVIPGHKRRVRHAKLRDRYDEEVKEQRRKRANALQSADYEHLRDHGWDGLIG